MSTMINGITYTASETTAYVSGSNDSISPNSVIESNVSIGLIIYQVTSISDGAFRDRTTLLSVVVPNSVTSIGSSAFSNCSLLTSITIPNSVTRIGQSAFEICRSLTSITIPNSVTSIGSYAFYNCNSLTSITIPNSVTSIGQSAFAICTSLTSITIPNSVTSIREFTFYYCTLLTSVTIPNSVTSISQSAFVVCTSLTSITIPNSVTSIGSYAFYNCTSLTSITIPNSVTSIGSVTFSNCPNLITVIIDNPTLITSVFPDSFTYVSSTLNSSITFNNTSNFNDLSATWQNISYYYATTIYNPPVVPPTIDPLTIPDKNFGDAPFQIVQPNSNSNGAFSYTSSDTSVATIFNNIITIWNTGTSTITANQAASGNYSSGSVSTTFTVNPNNSVNPAELTTGFELEYFLSTSATYGNLENSVTINNDLIGFVPKVLTSTNYVTIIKENSG